MTFPFPTFVPAAAASVSFTDSSVDTTNATAYTFSAQNLGTPAANRKMVAIVSNEASAGPNTVSSMTIGGVSASLVLRKDSLTASYSIEMWQADVPTGTTGDVVVTWSAGQTSCGLGLFAVYGAPAATHDTKSSNANPNPSVSINCPAGGVIVGGAATNAGATWTWAGITEAYDETVESTRTHTGAALAFANQQTGLTVSATPSSNDNTQRLVVASWGPS